MWPRRSAIAGSIGCDDPSGQRVAVIRACGQGAVDGYARRSARARGEGERTARCRNLTQLPTWPRSEQVSRDRRTVISRARKKGEADVGPALVAMLASATC